MCKPKLPGKHCHILLIKFCYLKKNTKKLYLIEGKAALIIYLISPQNEAPYENDNNQILKEKKIGSYGYKKKPKGNEVASVNLATLCAQTQFQLKSL